MIITKVTKWFLLTLVVITLTACGNSSNNDDIEPTAQELAIDKIADYAQNGDIIPTIEDYIAAGVEGVSSENIDEVNAIIEGLDYEDVDTEDEIQAIINTLGVALPDITAPVITLNGTSPMTIIQGNTYIESGANATDNRDGDLSANVIITGSVDTATVGTYTIIYTVTDNADNTTTESRIVHVILEENISIAVNTSPVANAGIDQTVFFGSNIILNGSASSDADGDTLSYYWTLTAPSGSIATLSSTARVNPTFTVDVIGNYILELTVNDGTESMVDSMTVVAQDYTYSVTSSGVTYSDFNGSAIIDMELSANGKTLYAAVNNKSQHALAGAVEKGLTVLNLTTRVSTHIDTGKNGRYVKLSNDGNTAYVTSGEDGNLTFIDLVSNNIEKTIYIAEYVKGIAVSTNGDKLYLGADIDGIAKVDLDTKELTDIKTLNSGWASTVILSADETKLYVSESDGIGLVTYNFRDDNFTVIDTTDKDIGDFDITNDELTAYASLGGSGYRGIDVVNMSDKNIITRIVDINSSDSFEWVRQVKLSADDKLLFVADQSKNDTLFVIDLENNNRVTPVVNTSETSCIKAKAVEVSSDGSKIFLGCSEGVIAVFDIVKIAI